MRLTGGRAAVRSLVAHGVEHLFGLPGVQSDGFYNAIYDEGVPFSVYTTRHEQGAAYMAAGYAITSDRVGVMSVVPGPGLLNAGAGIATAYGMCAPVVALVSQVPSLHIDSGRGLLHEIVDQPSITANISKWQARADDPDEVSMLIRDAFRSVRTGDPRPAVVELPADVLASSADPVIAQPAAPQQPVPDRDALKAAAALMRAARRPLIVVGGGAVDASTEVTALAERLQAPVAAHRRGRGVIDGRHDLAVSHAVAHDLWRDADLVVFIGSRGQQVIDWGVHGGLKQVWINADPAAPPRMGTPDVVIAARAQEALPALIPSVEPRRSGWPDLARRKRAARDAIARLQPQLDYLARIRGALGDDGIVVADLTQLGYVMRVVFDVFSPRTFVHPGYPGTLGYGFATALGAKVANPDVPVIAVVGDGGFMFTVGELATAVHYGIDTVTVLCDNAAFGNVKLMQAEFYGGRVHATDLTSPDFVALAEAFGATAVRTDGRPESIDGALDWALSTPGPSLVVVPQGDDWPSPWPNLGFPAVHGRHDAAPA